MMDNLKQALTSKRFWAMMTALTALIISGVTEVQGWDKVILEAVVIIGAYMVTLGATGFGKENKADPQKK